MNQMHVATVIVVVGFLVVMIGVVGLIAAFMVAFGEEEKKNA